MMLTTPRKAILLAQEDVNRAGGVGDKAVRLISRDSNSGSERGFNDDIERTARTGYNALGVAPMASDVSLEIDAFAESGAPLVTIDGDLADSRRSLYIGMINREAGEASAHTLVDLMPATGAKGLSLRHGRRGSG